jgi:hypothetical protein
LWAGRPTRPGAGSCPTNGMGWLRAEQTGKRAANPTIGRLGSRHAGHGFALAIAELAISQAIAFHKIPYQSSLQGSACCP